MMNGSMIGGMVQGTGGLIQANLGQRQYKEAKKNYENMEQLDYLDSLAYGTTLQNVNLAERQAQTGLPQESKDYYTDQVNRTTAAGLSSIGSLRSGISGVSSLATSVLDSNRQLASMDAGVRLENRDKWMQQRDNLVSQQETAFDYEMGYDILERSRYLAEMSAGRQQMNDGLQNFSDSGETFAGGGSGGGSMGGFM
jgi:hypothetical protein